MEMEEGKGKEVGEKREREIEQPTLPKSAFNFFVKASRSEVEHELSDKQQLTTIALKDRLLKIWEGLDKKDRLKYEFREEEDKLRSLVYHFVPFVSSLLSFLTFHVLPLNSNPLLF